MNHKRAAFFFLSILAQGCAPVDDYLLGKDNTPKPKELKAMNSQIKISKNWTAAVGKSHRDSEYFKRKPVVRGSIIYTADSSGLLQAVNKEDGTIKWSTQIKQGIVSGPTVAEGLIAVGTNASTLVVFNQTDGKELWQNKVSAEMLSPPALAHKKAIAKTIDGKVFAFDALSGASLWTVDHGAPGLVLKASSSPIIVGSLVLIGFSDGKLDALELETGRLVWQRSISYATGSSDIERLIDIDSDPIVKDQVAYLASYQGYIGALSLKDGQFIWKRSGSVYKNILLHSDTLYLTDSKDVIWSLDRHKGLVNWKQTALKARGLTEPVLVGQHLVVGDKMGYLHFIGLQTGELLARSQLSGGITVSPSAVGKDLYVLTDNGMLNQLSVG